MPLEDTLNALPHIPPQLIWTDELQSEINRYELQYASLTTGTGNAVRHKLFLLLLLKKHGRLSMTDFFVTGEKIGTSSKKKHIIEEFSANSAWTAWKVIGCRATGQGQFIASPHSTISLGTQDWEGQPGESKMEGVNACTPGKF